MFRYIDAAFKKNYMKSLGAILLFPIMKLSETDAFCFFILVQKKLLNEVLKSKPPMA